MTRAVVVDEHTLGVIYPGELQILSASIVRGSPYPVRGTVAFDPVRMAGRFRAATRRDFVDYMVVFHPDYLAPYNPASHCP